VIRLLLRSLAINVICIVIASQVLAGVMTYVGGVTTLLTAALVIAIVNLLIKPIINLLLLPLNLVTMGLFRWIANLVTLYIVTWLVPNIQIHSFIFPGLNLTFLIIPAIPFSAFGAFIVTTLVLTAVFHLVYWLLQD
jgi:putative membrane protein